MPYPFHSLADTQNLTQQIKIKQQQAYIDLPLLNPVHSPPDISLAFNIYQLSLLLVLNTLNHLLTPFLSFHLAFLILPSYHLLFY